MVLHEIWGVEKGMFVVRVSRPCVVELWPCNGPATGDTFSVDLRDPSFPGALHVLCPIGNGLYQPVIIEDNQVGQERKTRRTQEEQRQRKSYHNLHAA